MNMYLIKFTYDYYCQGYEATTEMILVYANSFQDACNKISLRYEYAREFQNLTIL